MPSALILSGGVTHNFPELSVRLAELLAEIDVEAVIRTDIEAAVQDLADTDLLVVNMLRWRMLGERYGDQREEWGLRLSEQARTSISGWIDGGGGMLAMHASSICFDDWAEWKSICGASWNWDTSKHPPVGPARIKVNVDSHPIVAALPDNFETDDEIYGFLDLADDVTPLLTGAHGGAVHPLLWARTVGSGRVVHNTLGHHLPSYESPVLQQIVRRSARWALAQPDSAVLSELAPA